MHIAVKAIIAFFGFGFLAMGSIFLIAGGSTDNYVVAAVLLAIGAALFAFIYRVNKQDADALAKRPEVHQHQYDITMAGSGDFTEQKLVCPYCGAPAAQENVRVIGGGLMIECPYCDKVSELEEAPKW